MLIFNSKLTQAKQNIINNIYMFFNYNKSIIHSLLIQNFYNNIKKSDYINRFKK
jgi:hypothetical protein